MWQNVGGFLEHLYLVDHISHLSAYESGESTKLRRRHVY